MNEVKVITNKCAIFSQDKIYYFRKEFRLKTAAKLIVNVTADARYKLYVNGKLVCAGPLKGCEREKYYDTVDISEYLQCGVNFIEAQVLQLSSADDISKHRYMTSVCRTGMLAFSLWGVIKDGENETQYIQIVVG